MKIDEENLKKGLLGLVMTLAEIIKDVLEHQALRRIEAGTLTDEEVERVGKALMDLESAIDEIKKDYELGNSVKQLRDGLDDLASRVLDVFDPEECKRRQEKCLMAGTSTA